MPKPTMRTVDKILSLLRHFPVQSPELGLSEFARLAGHDKTTVLRCMTALKRNGFIEKDARLHRYRLGLTPINLARIRERSFPLLDVLQPHLDLLRDRTQETAHATVLSSGPLMTALICEPDRATDLPLHSIASGLAIIAYLTPAARAETIAACGFEKFTAATTSPRPTPIAPPSTRATLRSWRSCVCKHLRTRLHFKGQTQSLRLPWSRFWARAV